MLVAPDVLAVPVDRAVSFVIVGLVATVVIVVPTGIVDPVAIVVPLLLFLLLLLLLVLPLLLPWCKLPPRRAARWRPRRRST